MSQRSSRVGVQTGLRSITIRNRAAVGCPKVVTVWAPQYEFDRALSAARLAAEALGVPQDVQEVDP